MLADASFNHITHEIIGSAIEVHRVMGPGLLESTYVPCLEFLPVHEAQMLTYLGLTGCPAGLLINFNVAKLVDGLRRLLNPRPSPPRR